HYNPSLSLDCRDYFNRPNLMCATSENDRPLYVPAISNIIDGSIQCNAPNREIGKFTYYIAWWYEQNYLQISQNVTVEILPNITIIDMDQGLIYSPNDHSLKKIRLL